MYVRLQAVVVQTVVHHQKVCTSSLQYLYFTMHFMRSLVADGAWGSAVVKALRY